MGSAASGRPVPDWGITLRPACSSRTPASPARPRSWGSGGRIGRGLASTLTDLFSAPGAFVLLVALAIFGVIVGFGIPLRQLTEPAVRHGPLDGHDRSRVAQAHPGRGGRGHEGRRCGG